MKKQQVKEVMILGHPLEYYIKNGRVVHKVKCMTAKEAAKILGARKSTIPDTLFNLAVIARLYHIQEQAQQHEKA